MKASELLKEISPLTQERLKQFREIQRQKRLVNLFDNCALCGAPLSFQYKKNISKYHISEEAHCQNCLERGPTRVFRIS